MPGGRAAHYLSGFLGALTTMDGDMTGDEARALRRGMRLSARLLALEVGTNESSVYRWERRGSHEVPRMYAYALLYVVQLRSRRRGNGENGDPLHASGQM